MLFSLASAFYDNLILHACGGNVIICNILLFCLTAVIFLLAVVHIWLLFSALGVGVGDII